MNTTLVRAREISLALLVTAVVDLRGPCKYKDAVANDSSRLLRLGRHLMHGAADNCSDFAVPTGHYVTLEGARSRSECVLG
jgi:hypothetical protein